MMKRAFGDVGGVLVVQSDKSFPSFLHWRGGPMVGLRDDVEIKTKVVSGGYEVAMVDMTVSRNKPYVSKDTVSKSVSVRASGTPENIPENLRAVEEAISLLSEEVDRAIEEELKR